MVIRQVLLDMRHQRQYNNEFSLHSEVFWRDRFLYPMYMDHRHHHHEIFQVFQDEGKGVRQEAKGVRQEAKGTQQEAMA